MGRVRTKTLNKFSQQVVEQYYSCMMLDFHTNKRVLGEVATVPTNHHRNNITSFSTHLMKRIEKGPVWDISLRLQDKEGERRMDFVANVSAITTDQIEVDKDTLDMLSTLGMSEILGLVRVEPVVLVQTSPVGSSRAGRAARRY